MTILLDERLAVIGKSLLDLICLMISVIGVKFDHRRVTKICIVIRWLVEVSHHESVIFVLLVFIHYLVSIKKANKIFFHDLIQIRLIVARLSDSC